MGSFERRGFADQLSIDTPEQVALEFPLAGLGSRFVALLFDHLVQGCALFLLALLVGLLSIVTGRHLAERLAGKWFLAGCIVATMLLLWGYFALFEAFWHGQTPGKRLLKLRVLKDSGRQITVFESLTRNLLRFVDFLPSLYLTGVIAMVATRRSQRLGDLAAATLVVHERPGDQPLLPQSARWPSEVSPRPAVDGADAASELFGEGLLRLGQGDLILIEAFFARAFELPIETRASMAGRILGQIAAKMEISPPTGNPERALETIAGALRSRPRSSFR